MVIPWGALIGGGLGLAAGMMGRPKRTGFMEAWENSQMLLGRGMGMATNRLNQYGGNLFSAIANVNPMFAAMQERVMGDLAGPNSLENQLVQGTENRVSQLAASRGMSLRGPSTVFQTALGGIQARQGARQQALQNAFQMFQASQPLLGSVLGAAGLAQPARTDLGIQQLGFRNQARQAGYQSMFGGLQAGINQGLGFNALSFLERQSDNPSSPPGGGTITMPSGNQYAV